MKKSIVVLSVLAVAAVASADLSISFVNNSHAISFDDPATVFIPSGSLVQLIWSQGDNVATRFVSGAGVGGGLKSGEFLLLGETTAEPTPWNGFGTWGPFGDVYGDGDVGGNVINSGYFFARVFDDSAAAGSSYYETTAVDASSWMFDPSDPNNQKTYSASIVDADGGAAAQIVISSNNTTVIPEPATFGLMGVAGLGLFLARKKARR